MPLTLVITDAGRAALVNAAHDGTRAVRIVSAGVSPNAVVASRAATALPGEIKRIASLAGDHVAADTIHLVIQDETDATYSLRSFALYLADGTLFALYGQAAPIIEKSAQAVMLLAIDAKLEDIAADTITFGNSDFINPPATTERRGVVELATVAEAKAGHADRVVTPETAIAALLTWLGYTPVNRAGDTMTGRLTHADDKGNWSVGLRKDANRWTIRDNQFGNDLLVLDPDGSLIIGAADRAGERKFSISNLVTDFAIVTSGAAGGGTRIVSSWVTGQQGPLILENASGEMARFLPDGAFQMKKRVRFSDPNGLWSIGLRAGANLITVRDEQFGTDTLVLDPAGNLIIGSADRAGERRLSLSNLVTDFAIVTSGSAGGGTRIVNSWVTGQQGPLILENASGEMARFTPAGALQLKQPASRAGNTVWDAGNDGAGSGLDADLLDGRDSTWFADIAARLGYTPLDAALYTAASVLARLITVDGSGSGLDADLLDGLEAAAFMLKSGGTFTGPITLKSVVFGGTAGNYSLSIADGADQVVMRDNQFGRDVIGLARETITIGEGTALKRAGSGRYVHFKDDLPGDTITRGPAAPSGGSDGDTHYQVDVAAGTMKLWHNYAGTWVHT